MIKTKQHYVLYIINNDNEFRVLHHFKKRYDAVEFAMKKYFPDEEIQHRIRHSLHNIEYYINDYHRFFIVRIKKQITKETIIG